MADEAVIQVACENVVASCAFRADKTFIVSLWEVAVEAKTKASSWFIVLGMSSGVLFRVQILLNIRGCFPWRICRNLCNYSVIKRLLQCNKMFYYGT